MSAELTVSTPASDYVPLDASTPLNTRFRIPFDTGDVDIVFKDVAPNIREKATLIGYMMRNIGLSLAVMSKFNLFGVNYKYTPPQDIAIKLVILGHFESTAQVNEWRIVLDNKWPDYTLNYELISNDMALDALFD